MSQHNLDRLFAPRRIAVVGASNRVGSVGYSVLRNLLGGGFAGVVQPVNPRHESVQSVEAFPSVAALPKVPDLVVVCSPADTAPGLVDQCGRAGVGGMVILSAGFSEAGAAGRLRQDALTAAAERWPRLRILGPNCLGFSVPRLSLGASFAADMPAPGRVAFVSQSGALCTSVLDWARGEGIGFSFFASLGNMLDVGFADTIDWLGRDPDTDAIILYVESIRDARAFMSAARAFARHKPILAYKAGRSPESARAAASHTGLLAGSGAVYDAAFQRAGIERVDDIDALFDGAEILARQPLPAGPRVAIVTNAGGPGVMATDSLIRHGAALAELSLDSQAALAATMPDWWSPANPIDLLGDAPPERFASAARLALADPGVDALLVILSPQAMTDPEASAAAIGGLRAETRKPILAAWMGGPRVAAGRRRLGEAGIACYSSPEQAVAAFAHMLAYARNREALFETPRDLALELDVDRRALRALLRRERPEGGLLGEGPAKRVLAAYGIPVAATLAAADAEAAVAAAEAVGYPVVLKLDAAEVAHKSDLGGVILDLADADAVRSAFARILARVRAARPDARVAGVTVQPMRRFEGAIELIVGASRDPTFGTALMVGLGGVAVELLGDRVLGLPPLNERLARRMLESLRIWPLLQGYRGSAPVDLDRLIGVLVRVSYLVADIPEILELDINPLLVGAEGVLALDARLRLDVDPGSETTATYAHLAIRPYPDEWVREGRGPDGQPLVLRPIRPEDEPRWHALLAACSPDSIRKRFRYLFKQTTHEMATRFCFIDYDREMAIVAEAGDGSLLGVGRLITDPGGRRAEFAVLVADAAQGRGLGGQLTDLCLEVARAWRLEAVYALTSPDNTSMLSLFQERGFRSTIDYAEGQVEVELALAQGAVDADAPAVDGGGASTLDS